jgi:hypothetical protein
MEIDATESRKSEHPWGDDAAVGDNDNCVGSDGLKLGAEVGVTANLLWLHDGEVSG